MTSNKMTVDFSSGNVDEALKHNLSDELKRTFKNINSLPLSEEDKKDMIENEIAIYKNKQGITLNRLTEINEVLNIRNKLISDLSFISSLKYEDIYSHNIVRIYSICWQLIRFFNCKHINLAKNNYIWTNPKTTYKYELKIDSSFSYEGCKKLLTKMESEISSIDNKSKTTIEYSTINEIFNVSSLLSAETRTILTDERLSLFFFGDIVEDLKNEMKTEENNNE